MNDPTSQAFFDRKYLRVADPWNFSSSAYEQYRYDAIIDALKHTHYKRAFEPGCSVGALTNRLVAICKRVEAADISPVAIEEAKKRCRDQPNVQITAGALPRDIPNSNFDLIVFSEIGYYFDERMLRDLGHNLINRLSAYGTFLACHWLGYSADHLLHGDRVHEILRAIPNLKLVYEKRHTDFRLDRWERVRRIDEF